MSDDKTDLQLVQDLMADYDVTPEDTIADLIEAIEDADGDEDDEEED